MSHWKTVNDFWALRSCKFWTTKKTSVWLGSGSRSTAVDFINQGHIISIECQNFIANVFFFPCVSLMQISSSWSRINDGSSRRKIHVRRPWQKLAHEIETCPIKVRIDEGHGLLLSFLDTIWVLIMRISQIFDTRRVQMLQGMFCFWYHLGL